MKTEETTQPTIETVFKYFAEMRDSHLEFRQNIETRLRELERRIKLAEASIDSLDVRNDTIEQEHKRRSIQIDRVAKDLHQMSADFYDLRVDLHKSV